MGTALLSHTLLLPPRPHRLDTLNTPLFINNVARVLHPTGGRHRGPPLRLRRLRRGSGDPHSFGLALGPSFPRGLFLALALAQGLRGSLVGLVAQRLPPRGPLLPLLNTPFSCQTISHYLYLTFVPFLCTTNVP